MKPKPSTLEAHIALDGLLACHQRLRELLAAVERREYTRAAFKQSFDDILIDLYLVDLGPGFTAVAEELED